jgi:hypothetical protein
MPDDTFPLSGEIGPDEQAVARDLAELGPWMRRQERAEAERPNPDFVRDLRARLMAAEPAVPDPQVARDLRTRVTGMDGLRGAAPQRRWRWAAVWAGLPAAALAALVAVIIVVLASRGWTLSPGRGTASVAWAPPAPGTGDLIRGFPFPPGLGGGGGGGGLISPEVSQFDAPWNAPYPGRLRLAAGRLHGEASALPAYQLRGPSFDAPHVARLAHLLGIRARATRAVSAGAIWAVAADGGLPSKQPLHSLAVSTATGELVYHNTVYQPLVGPPHAQDKASVAAAARAWLTRLGWPGRDMPLQAAALLPGGAPNAWIVDFGWPHVRGTPTSPAATLLIVPRWHVADARLWPPVARSRRLSARPVSAAWTMLQRGDIPLAVTVRGALTGPPGGGRGTVRSVEVVQVLTADVNGILYLVPAYRFAGTAQLRVVPQGGVVPRAQPVRATWYAVVPALAR